MVSTFGERLRQLRQEHNLKQSELGEFFSISTTSIGSYERNEREPTFKNLILFADYFNVSLDFLMGRSEERLTVKQYTSKDTFELFNFLDKYKVLMNGQELTDEDKQRIKDVCIALFLRNLDI